MEFLLGIASSIVGEITKYAIAPIGRQLGYLFHYQNNREKLRGNIEELDGKKESIDTQIEEGRKRGEKTCKEVDKWLKIVETRSKEANEMLKDEGHPKAECSCSGSFPNLVLRHQLSRKMKKMAETIAGEIQKADSFENNITSRPALIKSSFENEDFEVFDTRMLTLREIMKALKDPNCSKIGVYGIGGVGKTTLVKEVARQAQEEEKSFSAVVMVTVSQSFDLKSIQKEIAEKLGLPLKEESMSARADRLQDRLRSEKKILIILDDVWEKLELKDIGIIFDNANQKGCKILLVSRNQYVLRNDMGVEKDIEVGVLPEEEAMKLFNKVVDKRSDECDFKDLATAIVGEYCGGLPIAIVTIASALRGREIFVWRNTLNELKKSPKKGYKEIIKKSYDFLDSKQEKEILLLCSLFKEDANVSVEDLMNIYGAYSDMFSCVSLEEARVSVLTSVDNLKGCCLLLKGDKDDTFKLHDVIRRIMLSIAQEEGMWCFEQSEQHSSSGGLNGSTAISLIDHDINQLLESLACPRLKLLMHEESRRSSDSPAILFPRGFLEEAKELRALCLRSDMVKPLPLLSSSLQNLQTLSLQECVFEDIAFIGELNNLVVLDLSKSVFEKLPEQIGKLTCLRQLKLNNCFSLKVIPPNVLSRLVQLEELYMDCVHINWRTEAVGDMSKNASLVEIKNMSRLRALHLCIKDANVLSRGMFVDGKLKRFNIIVGCRGYHSHATGSRLLKLGLCKQSQLHECGFQMLMKECEVLHLRTLHGVNNVTPQLDADGFLRLKKLFIHENDEVQHIVESTGEIQPCSAFQNLETLDLHSVQNVKKIYCGSFRVKAFGRLRWITVSKCNKLKNVLPYFVGNWLEKIKIVECNMVKEIVHLESEDHATNCDKIEFPHLRSLALGRLPNLIHFVSSEMETTYCHASSTVTPGLPFFNAKVAFPSLEILGLREINFSTLWPNQLPATSTLQSLTRLDVIACHKLKYVFPFVIVGGLMQLEKLEVINCSALEVIITGVEEEGMSSRNILFPKLKYLKLENLESLQSFCDGDCNVELKSLWELTIRECPLLKSFTSKTRVDEEIGQPLINEKVAFPSLEILKLWEINISNLWPNQLPTTSSLQNLTRLNVSGCHKLKYVFPLVIVGCLMRLDKLEVNNCSAMEVIITGVEEEGMSSRNILFPKLKYLKLENLESLQSLCDGVCNVELKSLLELTIRQCPLLKSFSSNTRVDEEIGQPLINEKVMFKNLQVLYVINCKSLLCLWDLATFESLQQLKTLGVAGCDLMEDVLVVTKEPGDQERNMKKISFPKLESVELRDLPKLKRFYQGDCIIEFPSLLYFQFSNFTTWRIEVEGTEMTEVLFNEKVAFPRLDFLKLDKMDFSKLWPNQLPTTFTLQSLTRLDVIACHKLKYVFPFVIVGGLMQLEKLEVINCSALEVIITGVEEEGMSSRNILFPKLKYLKLEILESLQSFCDGDCNVELKSLLELTIRECPLLKSFTSKTRVDEEIGQPLINEKVMFKNLQVLYVENCKHLLCLWDLATFEGLQQLKTLDVVRCDLMEELLVVTREAGDQERNMKKISFPKLERVELRDLPKLKRFYQGDCVIEFPSLLYFHFGNFTTWRIEVEGTEMTEVLFNEKVAFPSLEILELRNINSSNLWPNQLPTTSSLQNLTRLNVTGCHKLKYVFPLVIVGCLMRLDKLEVNYCSAMEVIITGVEEEGMSSRNILFPKLKYLKLENLESLQSFCDGDCNVELKSLLELTIRQCPLLKSFTSNTRVDEEIGQPLINEKVVFKNLQELDVKNCKSLLCLWDLATFESLQQLKMINVVGCDLMEEILVVTKEAGDQERNLKKISFPKLERVGLWALPELKRFCQGDCTIEFPSLLELEIVDCPELKTFIAKSTTSATIIEKDVEEREAAEEILFSRKIGFKTLKRLTIKGCNSLLSLWELATCENIQRLKRLNIYRCELMEEILVVANEAGDQEQKLKKISFPKLENLGLKDLPKLKRFCQGDCTIEFLSALVLEIHNCTALRTLIANSTSSTSTIEKGVEEREMAEEGLFNGKVAFYNLVKLSVAHCENLKYLLPLAIAEKLVQLWELEVTHCSVMEELVVVVVEDEGGERMSSRKILFPELGKLNLEHLKSLKEICAGDCIIGCESTWATVTCCPLLKTLNEKVAFPKHYLDDDEQESS